LAHNEFRFKVIRDSIYGYIWLSKAELDVVNTCVFRRLHRIVQLAFSYLVCPTAMHTRLEHALGSMRMAGRVCDLLGLGGEGKRLARMAALLHDIWHGPFSHTFENVMEAVNPGKTRLPCKAAATFNGLRTWAGSRPDYGDGGASRANWAIPAQGRARGAAPAAAGRPMAARHRHWRSRQ